MAKLVPMSSVDAAWLGMEDPTNLMMVTGVMTLDGKVDIKRLCTVLDRRLAPFRRFHQRVVRPRSRGGLPHWSDDSGFAIENHVTHVGLAVPGDKALRELVSHLMSEPLDFTKPLWQIHVVDGYEGGSVVLARIHHCLADGIALVRVMLSLTDETANARLPGPKAAERRNDTTPWLGRLASAARGGIIAGRGLIADRAKMRDLAGLGVHGAYRLGCLVMLPPDPPTIFKGQLGRRKRAAWSQPIPLDDFKLIGKSFGVTVNDVLIAAATGALRRYMEKRGEPTAGVVIRASVPVNLRPLEDEDKMGNAFGLVFISLPVGLVNPVRRLRAIKREMDELKGSPEALVAFGVLNVIGRAPVGVERAGLRFFGRKATAVLTNVPGPRQHLYLAGRRLERIMFWVPQSGHLGLGISLLSYAGGVMLGVATDEGLVSDPEEIAEAFRLEFQSLKTAAGDAGKSPTKPGV